MRRPGVHWLGLILAGAVGCNGASPQVLDAGVHDAIDSVDSPSGCGVTPPPLIAGLCVLDSSGARATNPTGIDPIAVTVDSIGVGTPGSACVGGGPNGLDPNATTERFVLRASGNQQWTVYVVGATAAQLAAGDSIEMLLIASADPTGWVSQTLVLTRASHLVLFGAAMNAVPGGVLVPSIPAADLTVVNDDGVTCMDAFDVPCARRRHQAQIVFGFDIGIVSPGQTSRVGALTVSLAMFDQAVDNGSCDQPTTTVVVGFVTP